ncbi:hypothetical protein LINPERPRIM_LOCUS31699 [Linum perenne]
MQEYNASFERLMETFERFCEMEELKLPASISRENTALGSVLNNAPQVFDESPLPNSTSQMDNPLQALEPPMFVGDSDPSSWLKACVRIDYMMSWSVSLQLGYSHHFFDGSLESSTVLQFVFISTFTGIITLPKAASSTFEALLFLCTQLIRSGGELVFNRGGCVIALLGRDVKKWKRDGSYGFNSYHVGLQGRVELYTARWVMEGMLPFFMHTNDVQISFAEFLANGNFGVLFLLDHRLGDKPNFKGKRRG